MPQKHPRRKTCENPQEHELTTSGEPDDGKSIKSGSVGGTRKPTVEILQGGGCLPYDISVIYLFLDGELVGEAYCTELMGRRVSVWEAQAVRRADQEQAKEATAKSLEGRQRIRASATAGARILSLERKRLEQQRQLDLQRQEIHPSHVQATLQALQEHQSSSFPSSPKRTGFLPPAVPEDDPQGRPTVHLPVRKRRRADDASST